MKIWNKFVFIPPLTEHFLSPPLAEATTETPLCSLHNWRITIITELWTVSKESMSIENLYLGTDF